MQDRFSNLGHSTDFPEINFDQMLPISVGPWEYG